MSGKGRSRLVWKQQRMEMQNVLYTPAVPALARLYPLIDILRLLI